jgi:DNA polymerase III delta prime subunit
MSEEFIWAEKHRPKTVEDCILPDRIVKAFRSYVTDKAIPTLLLSGPSGTGKTTSAIVLCEDIGLSYILINGSTERGIDTLRTKIQKYASTVSLKGTRKVIIIDEADYLTPEAQAGFRGVIDEFSATCTFIFTCNNKARIHDAILSRSIQIDYRLQGAERPEMAKRLLRRVIDILNLENVKFDKQVIVKFIERHFPDYRRVLNDLQYFAAQEGELNAGILVKINDVQKLSELMSYLKSKNFDAIRKWVVMNTEVDPSRIFRKVYDNLNSHLEPASIPQAVVIIARYQYQAAFAADAEINLVACLTELMLDCTYVDA